MKSVVPWSPAPSLAVAACNDGARMQRAQPPLVLNRSRPQCVLSWDAFPLDLVHRVLAYLDGKCGVIHRPCRPDLTLA